MNTSTVKMFLRVVLGGPTLELNRITSLRFRAAPYLAVFTLAESQADQTLAFGQFEPYVEESYGLTQVQGNAFPPSFRSSYGSNCPIWISLSYLVIGLFLSRVFLDLTKE